MASTHSSLSTLFFFDFHFLSQCPLAILCESREEERELEKERDVPEIWFPDLAVRIQYSPVPQEALTARRRRGFEEKRRDWVREDDEG